MSTLGFGLLITSWFVVALIFYLVGYDFSATDRRELENKHFHKVNEAYSEGFADGLNSTK